MPVPRAPRAEWTRRDIALSCRCPSQMQPLITRLHGGGVDGRIYRLAYPASRSSNAGTIESECKASVAMRAAEYAKDTLATRFLADIIAVASVLHLLL